MNKILVIDDDQEFANYAGEFLKCSFCEADVRSDSENYKEFDFKKYDLVILDWIMPIVDGHEILKFLREKHPGLPVIVMSSNHDLLKKEVKPVWFAKKPYDHKYFKMMINGMLNG